MHRRHTFRRTRQARGMSLLELCVVVSIMLILAAMVTPRVMTVLAETRLRGSANEAASFLQQARMRAIRTNSPITVRYTTLPGTGGNFVYADTSGTGAGDGSGDGQYNGIGNGEPVVNLGGTVRFIAAGNPFFNPALIEQASQMVQNDAALRVTWGARGIPCTSDGVRCTNAGPVAFAYFLNDGSASNWAAVTVSPAGRIKVWMWTGAAWQ